MSGQMIPLQDLFHKRVLLITELSQANADYLRALQLRSGSDILLLSENEAATGLATQTKADAAIADCQARIDSLETVLSQIDQDIQAAEHREI